MLEINKAGSTRCSSLFVIDQTERRKGPMTRRRSGKYSSLLRKAKVQSLRATTACDFEDSMQWPAVRERIAARQVW